MKRPLLIGLLVIVLVPRAWGALPQYPNPYRQTIWNNLTDAVHTLGQSPQQAASTKMRLHAKRLKARLNSINQAKRKAWLNS